MIIGYSLIDPIIVVVGTLFALLLLVRSPAKLLSWLPAALVLYFFIPTITLLTMWQTVPTLLVARALQRGRLVFASFANWLFAAVIIAIVFSMVYSLTLGADKTRAGIRFLYYVGILGLTSFTYEMGHKAESYKLILQGLAVTGALLAAYGVYQIVAIQFGLPFRGIVRGTTEAQIAYEGGLLRINSFASEPKRLGYVLFTCGLAAIFWSQSVPRSALMLKFVASIMFVVSILTFSGSYFLSVFLFFLVAGVLYFRKYAAYLCAGLITYAILGALIPELGVINVISEGLERRMTEVEVGLDGETVYRQEFFAWDYIGNHIDQSFFGLGMGQYYSTLNAEYGEGVGLGKNGRLLPLNSLFLELLFDLGAIATLFIYTGLAWLVLKLRKLREHFLCLSILFLSIQSFTILTPHFIALLSGIAMARIQMRSKIRKRRSAVASMSF